MASPDPSQSAGPVRQRFEARLEHLDGNLTTLFIRVPFDPVAVWTERNRLRVQGFVNEVPIRRSLYVSRARGYVLLVDQRQRKAGKLRNGDMVTVELEPDLSSDAFAIPAELERLFRQERALRRLFQSLNESIRRYILDQIRTPKTAETRQRRAEHWAEVMLLVLEGELSLPPILSAAFAQQPLAHKGWKAITPTQRRMHLFSLYHAVGPDARGSRAEWIVDKCVAAARRKTK